MKLVGYHNTEISNVENILQHGFVYRRSDKHWLGQGIYFFSDIDVAEGNINMLKHEDQIVTIAVEIEVDESAYLDLDVHGNLNAFRRYCQAKRQELEDMGVEFVFSGVDKKTARLKYKCFFLDLFKSENGYAVVSKTFAKETTPYAEQVDGIDYLGLPFLETYICVADNEYIVKKNVVEKEWLV